MLGKNSKCFFTIVQLMRKFKYWNPSNVTFPMLIWLLVLLLPFVTRMGKGPGEMRNDLLKSLLLSNLLLIGIFYIHTYLIYPLLDKRNGIYSYVAALFVIIGCFILVNNLLVPIFPRFPANGFRPPEFGGQLPIRSRPFPHNPIFSVVPCAFVIVVSFCYRLYTDKTLNDKLNKERENIHLKTELDFLRSQISPHFIFNLMNTFVSMARKKSELLEPALISLSQLMRYMLYDSDGSQIKLEQEIEYLKNYVNLQLLRFGDDVRVNITLSGPFNRYLIEPMLLIPFVENAFKHGISMIKSPIIDISIAIDEDEHILRMIVINNVGQVNNSPDKSSGIGLVNVVRRLELLYPHRYKFSVNNKDDIFTSTLQINL